MVYLRADFPAAFNGMFQPAITKVRCPKCGSKDLVLTEKVDATTTWSVVGGKLNRQDGIHDVGGCSGVDGECSRCRHGWSLRNAIQITDVVTELHHETFEPLDNYPSRRRPLRP